MTDSLYEWKGRAGPFELLMGPGVFRPSSTSVALAEALQVGPRDTVLDVGCGSGVLSFVAASLSTQKTMRAWLRSTGNRNGSIGD
jgi:16S rRNA G1207 methylase RsmC